MQHDRCLGLEFLDSEKQSSELSFHMLECHDESRLCEMTHRKEIHPHGSVVSARSKFNLCLQLQIFFRENNSFLLILRNFLSCIQFLDFRRRAIVGTLVRTTNGGILEVEPDDWPWRF